MANINTNMQFYCSTLAAFNQLTDSECFVSKSIKDTFVANIFSFEYTVVFSGIHKEYKVPVILSVLLGRAYANDTASMAQFSEKQNAVINDVKSELPEKSWTDDTLITTGNGFSITETQIKS